MSCVLTDVMLTGIGFLASVLLPAVQSYSRRWQQYKSLRGGGSRQSVELLRRRSTVNPLVDEDDRASGRYSSSKGRAASTTSTASATAAAAGAGTEGGYAISSLQATLATPAGVQAFMAFLTREFSSENLLFWVQANTLEDAGVDDPGFVQSATVRLSHVR